MCFSITGGFLLPSSTENDGSITLATENTVKVSHITLTFEAFVAADDPSQSDLVDIIVAVQNKTNSETSQNISAIGVNRYETQHDCRCCFQILHGVS